MKPEEPHKLQFFLDILKLTNTDYSGVAEILQCTYPNVRHLLTVKQDMKLSDIQLVTDTLGYIVSFKVSKTPETPQMMLDIRDLNNDGIGLKRLFFLSRALREAGMTKVELAKRLGLRTTTLMYWWGQDDISWQRLLQVTKALEYNLFIDIKQKEDPCKGREEYADESRIFYHIESNESAKI